jgi:hypothetical protein
VAFVHVAALTDVTVNFQDCYRKTVAYFVGCCQKKIKTMKTKLLIPLNDLDIFGNLLTSVLFPFTLGVREIN